MKKEYVIKGYNRVITSVDMEKSADLLAKTAEQGGTISMYLDMDRDGKDIAIVIGWQSGFDEENMDKFSVKEGNTIWRLCVKIGYQNSNSMMQCDYDIDWYQPWNGDGDVIDSEIPLYEDTSFAEVLAELGDSWKYIDKNWNKLGHD